MRRNGFKTSEWFEEFRMVVNGFDKLNGSIWGCAFRLSHHLKVDIANGF